MGLFFIVPYVNHIKRLEIRIRFQVVTNVVDTTLFYLLKESTQKLDSRKRSLTVAFLTPIKGIPYLLEALVQLREKRDGFTLDIVGDGLELSMNN